MFQKLRQRWSWSFNVIFIIFVLLFMVWFPTEAFGPLGDVFRINTYTDNQQVLPSTAISPTGDFVVVWTSDLQDGNGNGIYGQRYDSEGLAQGAEFRVNAYTTSGQVYPDVAMDNNGNFVVTWVSADQDGSSNGIYAQRYNALGVPQDDEFLVNVTTTGSQHFPSIAMSDAGDFIIAWEGQGGTNGYSAEFARRFNADGTPQGSEFQVNTTDSLHTSLGLIGSEVAIAPNGNFIISWMNRDGGGIAGIFARIYDSAGVAQSGEIAVNTTTANNQFNPRVAIDTDGDFVVVWESYLQDGTESGIYARRFDAAGIAQSGEFRVNTYTLSSEQHPTIAADDNGHFVIAWTRWVSGCPNGCDVYARRYDFNGTALNQEFFALYGYGGAPAIAMNGAGTFVLSANANIPTSDTSGIFGRIFGNVTLATPPALTDEFLVNTHTANAQNSSSVAMSDSGNFVITWQSNEQDGNGTGIYAQRYNALARPQGGEFRVNTTTQFSQRTPDIAMNSNGDFVVTWTNSGGNYGIYAQRFNSAGAPQGTEITVYSSSFTPTRPSVAIHDNGDFVITWATRVAASTYHVYAQCYNATGAPQGGLITVDTTAVPTNTVPPDITMDGAGNFIITWTSTPIVGDNDVYVRRFTADGVPLAGEFRVNTFTLGEQEFSSIAADNAGNFVVTWQSWSQDGDDLGVYAQRYNSSGVAQGLEFQVNMNSDGTQGVSSIAMDDNGNLVIVWAGEDPTANSIDVYARTYNAGGVSQIDEFLVNVDTTNYQGFPAVAMNNSGNFVATYLNTIDVANGEDVYARLFGPPIVLNPTITENEFYTAFEQERTAFPAITQGIADFVPNGINMTVTLNTGETGRVNFAVENADGFVTMQIASITNLSGGAASQNYVDVVSRDLPSLITATLDNLVTARFGAGQNVESMNIDNSSMTLLLTGS